MAVWFDASVRNILREKRLIQTFPWKRINENCLYWQSVSLFFFKRKKKLGLKYHAALCVCVLICIPVSAFEPLDRF